MAVKAAAKGLAGAIGGAGAGVGTAIATGLVKAEEVAGAVLRPIFGGLPWEMSGQEIANAVIPGMIDVAGSGVLF